MHERFTVYADYHQFYVEDAQTNAVQSAAPGFWSQEAFERGLAVAPDMIAIGTARYGDVDVTIEVLEAEPTEAEDADQINECSLEIPSGEIVVRGCTQDAESAPRMKVNPGVYRVRVFYSNLDVEDPDAENGDDAYKVVLWPGDRIEPRVLKNYNAEPADE